MEKLWRKLITKKGDSVSETVLFVGDPRCNEKCIDILRNLRKPDISQPKRKAT